jgi:putative membrane-bound dehydrogenase-like protein
MIKFRIFGLQIIMLAIALAACKPKDVLLKDFQIESGFDISLAAREPLIQDPVDFEFNEWGDALVLEMPGYPLEDKQSRLKALKDKNHDGIYDEQILFAENLRMATSVLPYKSGVLVSAPPYLLYLKDEDHNYQVDAVDTLMGGFSTGNLQHNYNGLTYGLDNWIYAANGGNSGKPYWWNDTTSAVDLRGQDIRFNLNQKRMERIGESSGGFGLAMDDYGRIFETHNLTHVSQLVFPDRYIGNRRLLMENSLSNISDHEENGLARIYPIGEQESRVNHPEQSGYFSGSCGITFYGGGAFGPGYENTIWVADVVLNLIHVDKVSASGAGLNASRVLHKKEFLASRDRSFRPVNMTVGPDGVLYVVDMYRAVIEHPEWIPDDLEKSMDLNAGKDKGRIYRITRQGSKQPPFDFEKLKSVAGRIESLGHPNQWVRKTAHRLLIENAISDSETVELINALKSENSFKRLHAMWILSAKNYLQSDDLVAMLGDAIPAIRENALIVSESINQRDDELNKACIQLLIDENQRVRMQAALSLSMWSEAQTKENWSLIKQNLLKGAAMPSDAWNVAAVTIEAHFSPVEIFKAGEIQNNSDLVKSLALSCSNSVEQSAGVLRTLVGSTLSTTAKSEVVDQLLKGSVTGPGKSLLSYFETLEKSGDLRLVKSLNELRTKYQLPTSTQFIALSKVALTRVADNSLPDSVRLQQLAMLSSLSYPEKADVLFQCLSNAQPLAIQEEALRQLSTYQEAEIGKKIVSIWKQLGPRTRRLASDLLLYIEIHHDALLTGLENGTINIGEMNFDLERRRTLLWWTDNAATKRRAEKLFSDVGVVTRQQAIDKMKDALTLRGNSGNGAKVFQTICSNCHLFGTVGKEVGPVLTEISRKSKETLLHDILDPNAATDPRYISHRLVTQQGTVHMGIVKNETDQSITIMKMGGESVTVQKSDIKEFNSLGTSLMMESLEGSMNLQEMADLLAYLQNIN